MIYHQRYFFFSFTLIVFILMSLSGLKAQSSHKDSKKSKKSDVSKAPTEIATDPYANETVNLLTDIPQNIKSNAVFILKNLVYKGKIKGPGRLVQILPNGLTVLDTLIAGAKTKFANNALYLNWDELPADSVFEVSYKVKPIEIYGSFQMVSNLYLERTGKEYKFRTSLDIEPAAEEIAVNKTAVEDLKVEKEIAIMKPPVQIVKVEEEIAAEKPAAEIQAVEKPAYKEPAIEEPIVEEPIVKEPAIEKPVVEKTDVQKPAVGVVKTDYEIAPNDVEYRVQIRAAYKAKIPIETLAKKFNLSVEFKEDCISNWCYYSVGSFDTYAQAKEYRNTLMNEHAIRDAFIVAFYKGRRLNELSELKEIAAVQQPIKTVYKEGGYCYRVQILALMNKTVNPESLKEMHKIDEEVNEEVYHNWRKYTVGKCTSISEAKLLLVKMKEKGITDAFISIYKDGERVLSK
jgi:hypothetical protein